MFQRMYANDSRTLPQGIREAQLHQIEKLRESGQTDHPLLMATFIATDDWK